MIAPLLAWRPHEVSRSLGGGVGVGGPEAQHAAAPADITVQARDAVFGA